MTRRLSRDGQLYTPRDSNPWVPLFWKYPIEDDKTDRPHRSGVCALNGIDKTQGSGVEDQRAGK